MQSAGQLIASLGVGKFARITKVIPHGSLEARKLSTGGVTFYWRVTAAGKTVREPIGTYDSLASPKSLQRTARGYSVQAAIRAAEALAHRHDLHKADGGHAVLKQAEKVARAEAIARAADERKHTLECLLNDYTAHLEALGRRSHADARSIFKVHVLEPWPKVAALPAQHVTMEQVADMMRRTLELGKGRTSNKLRSYLRAAYQTAKASRSKARGRERFMGYAITTNPAADTSPDESSNNPDKRPLSIEDMRAYWHRIKDLAGFKGAVLRLHLLTGGQRIEQLVNLRTSDIASNAITLFDGKGRPGTAPRPHSIPLTTQAAAALKQCAPVGEFAISTDHGDTHLAATTLSAWAVEAVGDTIPDFQAKRIRSGVETLLAGARVSREIRGRLQSHGVAGVQARHYDGHEYMDEKREVLVLLHKLLVNAPAKVTNIKERRKA